MKKDKTNSDRKLHLDPLSLLHQPHDKYVRFVLQAREVALEFIQFSLKPEVFDLLDTETLTLSDDTFVDKHLQTHFADICYTGSTKTEKPFRVSIIFEHKSVKPGESVLAQLLRYISNMWSADLKQGRDISLSIPVLIYHGKTPLQKETPATLFPGAQAALLGYIPHFDYEILDIARIDDEVIEGLDFLLIRNILLALKHGRNPAYIRQFWKKIIIFAPTVNDKVIRLGILQAQATVFYITKISPEFIQKIKDMDNAQSAEEQEVMDVIKPYFLELYEKGVAEGKMETLRSVILAFRKKNPDWTDQQVSDLFEIEVTLVRKL